MLLETIGQRKIIMPKKTAFMINVEDRFLKMKKKLIEVLEEQKFVCTTCDVWSSRATSYLGMTVHFIAKDFQHHSYVLAFRKLEAKQTYMELATAINDISKDFNLLKDKITNIVTDGGSAYCKAFKNSGKCNDMLVENISCSQNYDDDNCDEIDDMNENGELRVEGSLPYMQNDDGELYYSNVLNFENNDSEENLTRSDSNEDFENGEFDLFQDLVSSNQCEKSADKPRIELPPQRRCMSHLLNLISADFDEALPSIVKSAFIAAYNKLHALWTFTHRSSHARIICKQILECLLLVPCETRWNSKYYAIEKTCRNNVKPKINELIKKILNEIKGASHLQVLSTNDWAVLNEYLKVMGPIAQALNRLQSEKNGSQGMIMPILLSMRYHITSLGGSNLLNSFRKVMLDVIQNRFNNYFEFNVLNCELVIASVTSPIFKTNFIQYDSDERRAREMFREECCKVLREKYSEKNDDENDTLAQTDSFFVDFTHRNRSRRNSIENDVESEMSRYLNDARAEITMLNEYPLIRELYFRYNTTLSASAAIERVFIQSALIFRPHRNRISPANFERTLLLKYNRKLIE